MAFTIGGPGRVLGPPSSTATRSSRSHFRSAGVGSPRKDDAGTSQGITSTTDADSSPGVTGPPPKKRRYVPTYAYQLYLHACSVITNVCSAD